MANDALQLAHRGGERAAGALVEQELQQGELFDRRA